jgi:hypothetical protein
LGIILLLFLLWLLLQAPFFQQWLTNSATAFLSKQLHTRVQVRKANIGFLNRVHIQGVFVQDEAKDTLVYIGEMQVNLTDWFLWKDRATLEYVKLKDVNVQLYRGHNQTWNYQFLVDYFSGESKNDTSRSRQSFTLQVVDIENIHFRQHDAWRGREMVAGVGRVHLNADKLRLDTNNLFVRELLVQQPEYREYRRHGLWSAIDSVEYYRKLDSAAAARPPRKPRQGPTLELVVGKFRLDNGLVELYNRPSRKSVEGQFDERDIIISGITGHINNLKMADDTLTAQVHLSAKERGGIDLKTIDTRFTMHPQLMEFDSLDLQVNNSRLGPYYAMRYQNIDDMEDFIDKVEIEARFINSKVDMQDIAHFASELKSIKQTGIFTGWAKGTVSDFVINNLDLRTGQSRLRGTYRMKGLVDIEKTKIDFVTPGSQVSLPDVAVWAPQLLNFKNTPFGNLGTVTYAGSYTGTVYNFKSRGTLSTAVGTAAVELNMKLDKPGQGFVAIVHDAHLDGGRLLDIPALGKVHFNGQVAANSFEANDRYTITGNLDSAAYAGYTYRQVGMQGKLQGAKFEAFLNINDPNLRGSFSTFLNLAKKKQRYNASGLLEMADLRSIGLVPDTLILSGYFDVDFQGASIDQFQGYTRFYDAGLLHNGQNLNFDSLVMIASIDSNGIKTLTINTNEAYANLTGRFNIEDVIGSVQEMLHSYYPSIISLPKKSAPRQDLAFKIETKEIEPFLKLIDHQLGGLNFASIEGAININEKQLLINATLPSFTYGSLELREVKLRGVGDAESLMINGEAASVTLGDSLTVNNPDLVVSTRRDSTHFIARTRTQGPLGDAEIDAYLFAKPNGMEIVFNESSFILNQKKWTIQSDGNVEVRDKYLISKGLSLTQEGQEIKIRTSPSEEGHWNDLHIQTTALSISEIIPFFVKEPYLEGLLTSEISITDPLGQPHITGKLDLSQFRMDSDSIGGVHLNMDYRVAKGLLNGDINSDNPDYRFSGKLKLNLKDSVENQIDLQANLERVSIRALDQYLTSVFDAMDGTASGTIGVQGKINSPQLTGVVQMRNAHFTVGYTKVPYSVDSAEIILDNGFIDFGVLNLKDRRGRKGQLEGRLYHRFFQDMRFDLHARSAGMEVLNTRSPENDLFYGRAVAKVAFDLTGPMNDLLMRILGEPTDSSVVTIKNTESRESGEADFIRFKSYGQRMEDLVDTGFMNLRLNLDLIANPLCRIEVIMDEVSGDIIKCTGSGNLKVQYASNGTTTMNGRYTVNQGLYTFNFQTLIRKPFSLSGDNNYIEWSGDPYNARLNISAQYVAKSVALGELVTTSSSGGNANTVLDNDAQGFKGDVNVVALLTGMLSNPKIDFDISFPQGSAMQNNMSAQEMLKRIKENQNELVKQVTYLIVFNSFAPYGQGASVRSPGIELGVNTLSELVSKEMEKILANVLQGITGDRSLEVDFSTNLYSSATTVNGGSVESFSQYDRMSFNFSVRKSYFQNRVVVNLGSDFDMSVRSSSNSDFQFLPNVSVEFILTENRRLRFIVFRKDNLDYSGRRNRAGASISYRKDYEKFLSSIPGEGFFQVRRRQGVPAN